MPSKETPHPALLLRTKSSFWFRVRQMKPVEEEG